MKNCNFVYNIESIFFFYFRLLGSIGKVFLYSVFMKSNDRNVFGNCVLLWLSVCLWCKVECGYYEIGDYYRCVIYKIVLGI